MKKRLLHLLGIVVVVGSMLMGVPPPVRAASSTAIPRITEKLESGWKRVAPTTIMHVISSNNTTATVEYKISTTPTTLSDNTTLIDNKWYLQVDPSGQWWFENGSNIFKSRVTADKISVLDANGRLTEYSSVLSIQATSYKGGVPQIVNDPITGTINTSLAWSYGKYTKTSSLTRYLRSNNGRLSEIWVLSGDPGTSLIFRPNITQENKYGANTTPMFVFDSRYHIVPVTEDLSKGYYVINPKDLVGVTYPLYIDPTYSFSALNSAWIWFGDPVYNTARTAAAGMVLTDGDMPGWIGQEFSGGQYYVDRSFVEFDTTTIPTNLSLTSAYIYLFGLIDDSVTDYEIFLCSGQPVYPHNPIVIGDYNYVNYQTDLGGGYPTFAGWSTTGYNQLTLSNVGWINKGGITKLALRSSNDIAATAPTGQEDVAFWQAGHGAGFAPQISIVGTIPITGPIVATNTGTSITTTSALLSGYLSDDGGATCSIQFQYGTTTGYGLTTAWVSGFNTGQSFTTTIAGLTPGITYHYRAVAANTFGTGYGSDSTFTTAPMPPSFFTATSSNAAVNLTWTKGAGADKTVIMRKTGSYPSSITDGTQVYSSTGTSFNDAPLVNATTYYYSAWSLAIDAATYSLTSVQSFATPAALGAPGVLTGSASGVTVSSAIVSGTLTSLGGYTSADVHFDYGKTLAYEVGSTAPQTLTAIGTFTATLSTLDPATLYHYRAVAIGTGGTTNGVDATFTTGGNSAPTMTTNVATGVQITSAQLNGNVTSDGGVPPVTVWFQYGLTTQYELGVTPTAAGLATGGTFYYGLGGLSTNVTYHYRSVGQNSLGTNYGGDHSFITGTALAPTVQTNTATDIGAAQATLQGTVVTDGGTTCTLTFDWGPTIGYGNTITAAPSTGSAGTTFKAILTGLSTNVTYHFRARATNNGGSANGTDVTFTTVFGPPTNFMAIAISSTTINLNWVLQGDQTYITYKTTGYPVNRNDGTQVYFGPNTYATLSGLTAGTTYYFSAWSWKIGDIWTTTNSNAIATTSASTGGTVIPVPTVPMGSNPITPTSWFAIPDNAVIKNLPLYSILTGWATAYQVPEGTFWAFVSVTASTLIGAVLFIAWKQAIPAVAASLGVIVVAGLIHACPPIFAAFIAAIEIGGGYGLMSLGGNIAGKGP